MDQTDVKSETLLYDTLSLFITVCSLRKRVLPRNTSYPHELMELKADLERSDDRKR